MQFDLTGFLIFIAFILPGFVAQKARDSITPRTLKPQSVVSEVGEFVLAGILSHISLIIVIRAYFVFFQSAFFAQAESILHSNGWSAFLASHRPLLLGYFILSLLTGYIVGGVQGCLILRQPVRNWVLSKPMLSRWLQKLGISGFLREQPVWYFVFQQRVPDTHVFLEVEMKDSAGFYTGELTSYGLVDDSEENKDFYITGASFKPDRDAAYKQLSCDGLLLNFKNVASLQVVKTPPDPHIRTQEEDSTEMPQDSQWDGGF